MPLRYSPRYGQSRGYLAYSEGGVIVKEAETYACAHCSGATLVKPFCDPADAGGLCTVCGGLTCPRCTAVGECEVLEAKLSRWEASEDARRSYGC